jgi:hypothetical protein
LEEPSFAHYVNDIKRMILKIKMQYSPIENSVYQKTRISKPTSDTGFYKPSWKLSYHGIELSTKSKKQKEMKKQKPTKSDRPFILNLVPLISQLSPCYENTAKPYRLRFENEYEKMYHELVNQKLK